MLKVRSIAPFVVLCVACGSSADPTPGSSSGAPTGGASESDPTFTQTMVVLNGDGTRTVTQRPIKLSEQIQNRERMLALAEARRKGEKIPESLTNYGNGSGCAGSNYITDLFDQEAFEGNEICFINNGTDLDRAYLPSYIESCSCRLCLCPTYWAGDHVNSWATGEEYAAMTNSASELGTQCADMGYLANDIGGPGGVPYPLPYDSVQNYLLMQPESSGSTEICHGGL